MTTIFQKFLVQMHRWLVVIQIFYVIWFLPHHALRVCDGTAVVSSRMVVRF